MRIDSHFTDRTTLGVPARLTEHLELLARGPNCVVRMQACRVVDVLETFRDGDHFRKRLEVDPDGHQMGNAFLTSFADQVFN